MFSISGNANGLRASECRHAVEHTCTNRNFGCLRADLASPQGGASEDFEPVHQGQRATMIATRLLPFTSAACRDCVDGSIAPSRSGRALWPRCGALAWRNRRGGRLRASQFARGTPWCRRRRRRRSCRMPRRRDSSRANQAIPLYRLRPDGSSAPRRSDLCSRP